jgi:hypothetical protein
LLRAWHIRGFTRVHETAVALAAVSLFGHQRRDRSTLPRHGVRARSRLFVRWPACVRDRSGRELAGASVAIDQGARTVTIDGKPVAIDPGIHSFSFSAKGFQPRAESVVILAGERYRPITVALEPAGTQLSSSEAQASMQSSQAAEPSASSPPLGSYVLGGVALLSVGAAVGLRVWGANEFDTLSRECKPDCSQSSVDSVEQKYLLSNIALAVGGAAAIAGIAVYVFASPKASLPTAALRVSQSNHGVSASITTGF